MVLMEPVKGEGLRVGYGRLNMVVVALLRIAVE